LYSIYEILNPFNGKKYIGCTMQTLAKRFQNGSGYANNAEFYNDIKRLGWDAFAKRTICSFENKDEALEAEEHYIAIYKTLWPHGYNLRSGGKSDFPVESVGKNISKAMMGHSVAMQVRERLSEYGRRPVVQLTLDFKYIKTYPAMTIAADAVGSKKTNICAACKGKKPTSGGYRWMYEDEYNAKISGLEAI